MSSENQDFREALAERDLTKGLELASTELSEDQIRSLVDDFFSS